MILSQGPALSVIRRDQFVATYQYTAVDTDRLQGSGAPGADQLLGADLDGNGEIAEQPGVDEMGTLFDRMAALDPNASQGAFDPQDGSPAGEAFNMVALLMRQKSGPAEDPLGTRLLSDVDSLKSIFDGEPGARLRRVDGRSTVGTGPLQDALNEIARADEARHGAGYRSPFRVDTRGSRGFFGPATEAAVEAFQSSVSIDGDGVVDQNTIQKLEAALVAARAGGPALSSVRFASNDTFRAILAGDATLAPGASDADAVEILQLTLYSLGYDLGPAWVDRDFAGATSAALAQLQRDGNLEPSGSVDKDTLLSLDRRAAAQVSDLIGSQIAPDTKHQRFRLIADIAPQVTERLYVVDASSGAPIASYLTSSGRAGYETQGDAFVIQRTMPRATWYPPKQPWADGLDPVPPGIDNPMGILKLDLGAFAEYIHGVPKGEVQSLGAPSSHGCLHLSPTNILDLHERWAEAGTAVSINRDPAQSAALQQAASDAGIADLGIDVGREWLAGYVFGELGKAEAWRGGHTVLV
jgi:peptidoglycan hydrolase-like protein with peptidoglycan-binding domain